MKNNITAIEFCRTGIRLVTGYCFNGRIFVRQALEGESIAADKAGHLNIADATSSLMLLLTTAKKSLHEDLGLIVPIFPPVNLKIHESFGSNFLSSSKVTNNDYNNCIGIIMNKTQESDSVTIFTKPFNFYTEPDNQNSPVFPLGKEANKLTIYADSFAIDTATFNHYRNILGNCGLKNFYFYSTAPLAATYFINKEAENDNPEKYRDYIAISFEADFTLVSLIKDKRMTATFTIDKGINDVVKKTALDLNTSFEKANELKNLFGLSTDVPFTHAFLDSFDLKDYINSFQTNMRSLITYINDAIAEFRLNSPISLILYGPGSDILYLDQFIAKQIGINSCVVFKPQVLGARNQVYTNCLGAILMSDEKYLEDPSVAIRNSKDKMLENDTFGRYR